MSEQLEPLATEAGQQAIVRAINNLSSLEYAVRAEHAATEAAQSADDALTSATNASNSETKARDWAEKTNGAVETETIVTPPETEGDPPTEQINNYYSAKYWAQVAEDYFSQMTFDTVPTEDSTNGITSGAVYDALNLKADKSTTYTKTEVDTQISTAVSNLVNSAPSTLDTLEELADALGDDPNFATTIATQLGNKADKSNTYTKTEVDTALSNVQGQLTFDSTPTANSNNPVTSGGIYTALQNVSIDIDDEITEDSDNPVTSAAIWEALQNFTPSGGGEGSYITNSDGDKLFEDKQVGQAAWATYQTVDLSKYDALKLVFKSGLDDSVVINSVFPSYYINKYTSGGNNQYITVGTFENKQINVYFGQSLIALSLNGNTTNALKCDAYGIKFSKNLTEQMYSNVLYENASGWSSDNITLSDSLENYDFIEFIHGETSSPTQRYSSIFSQNEFQNYIDNNNRMVLQGNGSQYFMLTIYSNTQLNYVSRNANVVYKIIGHKMAKGGYSGIVSDARMTVKSGTATVGSVGNGNTVSIDIPFDSPMPDTNYKVVATLNTGSGVAYQRPYVLETNKTVNGFKLNVYCTGGSSSDLTYDWIAIRPNSYTREGMVEDVLFSNASGVYSGTINLSGNISDYDLIVFETNRSRESNSLNQNRNIFRASSLHELTDNTPFGNCILVTGYGSDYLKFAYVNDNTLNAYEGNNLKLLKIIGIKFGRYVGNVAIDSTVTSGGTGLVTGGAVYTAIQNATPNITIDSSVTQNGTNAVSGSAVYTAIQTALNSITNANGVSY